MTIIFRISFKETILLMYVYSISANAGEYYAVNPLLSESEWIGEAYAINADDEDVDCNS